MSTAATYIHTCSELCAAEPLIIPFRSFFRMLLSSGGRLAVSLPPRAAGAPFVLVLALFYLAAGSSVVAFFFPSSFVCCVSLCWSYCRVRACSLYIRLSCKVPPSVCRVLIARRPFPVQSAQIGKMPPLVLFVSSPSVCATPERSVCSYIFF